MSQSILNRVQTPADLRRLELEELKQLAEEIRQLIKTSVSANGGHLASNLGVVELTIALHYVFDFRQDKLIWDVGHQCYVHKILTGRADRFMALRQQDGLSGFPDPEESPYDQFKVGHAGTAMATAVGMALGAQLSKTNEHVVALIGDASIVNGLSFEGLNNLSLLQRPLLVILNDNSMAIDRSEGTIARYLDQVRMSRSYDQLQRHTRIMTKRLPMVGEMLQDTLERIKGGIKRTLRGGRLFAQLSIPYYGPVDGHDVGALIQVLQALKMFDHPIMLHVQTEKGCGFAPATEDPCKFHSPQPFKLEQDQVSFAKTSKRTFTQSFAEALSKIMAEDEKVVALTAAMPDGTGLARLRRQFANRIFDVGIAESAAVDIGAGLAKQGLKPVVAIYSTFMQRAFDQVFQEISLQDLPITICMDRAGMVGGDGAVHHGFCDIALFRVLPRVVLMAPMDDAEMNAALRWAVDSGKACLLRYPRDYIAAEDDNTTEPFVLGKVATLRQGQDATILGYGAITTQALQAANLLAEKGLDVAVTSARFAKPLDENYLRGLWQQDSDAPIFTVEDHMLTGGFGTAVLEFAQSQGFDTRRLVRLGYPDHYIGVGSRQAQLQWVGLSAEQIAQSVAERLAMVHQR